MTQILHSNALSSPSKSDLYVRLGLSFSSTKQAFSRLLGGVSNATENLILSPWQVVRRLASRLDGSSTMVCSDVSIFSLVDIYRCAAHRAASLFTLTSSRRFQPDAYEFNGVRAAAKKQRVPDCRCKGEDIQKQ